MPGEMAETARANRSVFLYPGTRVPGYQGNLGRRWESLPVGTPLSSAIRSGTRVPVPGYTGHPVVLVPVVRREVGAVTRVPEYRGTHRDSDLLTTRDPGAPPRGSDLGYPGNGSRADIPRSMCTTMVKLPTQQKQACDLERDLILLVVVPG
eukprot:3419149-Rhodomonas_salina.1